MTQQIKSFFIANGFTETASTAFTSALTLLIIFTAAVLSYFIAKKILLRILKRIVSAGKRQWDIQLYKNRVFDPLVLIIPAFVVFVCAPLSPIGEEWLHRIAFCIIIFGVLRALDKFLNAADDVYKTHEAAKTRPIKGYLQVAKIIAYSIGAIVMVSVLIDRSPMILLGGIGAATAVLLLVFQNTILGFVASIQLIENDMIRLGDWIEAPAHEADGEVIELSLHTVKVQNWDKSITTIPTSSLITQSFKNWRNMQDAGGRRFKNTVYIDVTSIQPCDPKKMFERINEQLGISAIMSESVDIKANDFTNIDLFRIYMDAYIAEHPRINKQMTHIVRTLYPTQQGLPVEVFAFTDTTEWADYERIQMEILQHILIMLPKFQLRLFQNPMGYDISALKK